MVVGMFTVKSGGHHGMPSLLGSDVTATTVSSSSTKGYQSQHDHHHANSNNRIWIKQTAIDEARKLQKQQRTNKPLSEVSETSSNSSSTATPTARNCRKGSFVPSSPNTPLLVSSNHSTSNQSSISSFGSLCEKSPYTRRSIGVNSKINGVHASVILPAPMLSSCGSTGTTQETDMSSLCTDVSNHSTRQAMAWGWKAGYLIENSGGHVTVQLVSSDGSSSGESSTIKLPANALTVGDVVLGNDFHADPDTGMAVVPHDLITLTHLHEPAVIESLQHRYAADQIYTYTGPVLLALNPFQTVRGLYGDNIQKKYWERAERNLNLELPPHVYAIADESFRCMVRALEDNASQSTTKANQSILVSGESGAGKTVTTKFVMKYLAALSHRATALQQSNEKRAYMKAREGNNNVISSSSSGSPTADTSSYAKNAGSNMNYVKGASGGVNRNENSGHDLATVNSILSATAGSDSNSHSIEAQVLQSNPILESFGNARTVRNDNSSRFGKFIEIQFTQTGKLVGAQIETYLLEKVRLITQTPGERNYHIFYELLSGGIDRRELGQFFLAHTAVPDDFKITASSGTYDRRDGVSDRETYSFLRQALKTMNFSSEDVVNVFKVTSAILHASNLIFIDIPGTHEEECRLDRQSAHLDPVCVLLGVSYEALNQALCTYTIQAGKSTVITRSINKTKAATGLEALLKETYGALFNYLVRRVNDSIAYKDERHAIDSDNAPSGDGSLSPPHIASSRTFQAPAASVGVLDIFGFESFTTNSFEQLCINYCNEALQQQFNAFVLRNEQAEYEAEGIEWSFIEFPENQDALDLIDSNIGILRILDDQCRAPGPSDKAFAVNVYQQCSGSARFIANRKQQATLKFSVLHYAGPVEYSSEGFTEKNRDELPKESIELLLQSQSPFVRELAKIMYESPEESISVGNTPAPTNTQRRLHRVDSSVGRPTVGGQFRRQLKSLRCKIDLTTPHYVRCLKPNDHLVPQHFDTAVVAEQLRCGGILEAIRVARAGFTQHYPHADFVRRYRSLVWKELAAGISSKSGWSGSAPRTPVGTTIGNTRNFRNTKRHSTGTFSTPTTSFVPSQGSANNKLKIPIKNCSVKKKPQQELTAADAKDLCQDLIKVLYRKIQQADDANSNDSSSCTVPTQKVVVPPIAPFRAAQSSPKSYAVPTWSLKSPSSVKVQSALKSASSALTPKPYSTPAITVTSPSSKVPTTGGSLKGKLSSWQSNSEAGKKCTSPSGIQPAWKKRVAPVSTSDYGRVGIQMGRTKVFLRHKAFEALERIRSIEQNKAATLLNASFRMYLARIAYVPYRDAFRQELRERRRLFLHANEYKESKEEDFGDVASFSKYRSGDESLDTTSVSGVGSAIPIFFHSNFHAESLVDKWTESQIRDAIRNPVPRNEWGKAAPSQEQNFRWVISEEGLWIKNYNVFSSSSE